MSELWRKSAGGRGHQVTEGGRMARNVQIARMYQTATGRESFHVHGE